MWIRLKLPTGDWAEPHLYAERVHFQFEAFVHGKKIFQFGDISKDGPVKFAGVAWHLIPLQKEWLGEYLYFRLNSDINRIGIRGPLLIGSHADIITTLIKEDIDNVVLTFLFFFIGLFSLFLYSKSRTEKAYLSFSFLLYAEAGLSSVPPECISFFSMLHSCIFTGGLPFLRSYQWE